MSNDDQSTSSSNDGPPPAVPTKRTWFSGLRLSSLPLSKRSTTASFSAQDADCQIPPPSTTTTSTIGQVGDSSTGKNKIKNDAIPASTTTTTTNNNKTYVRDPIYLWSSLVAGAGSGALASVICAPLDLIRTRMQVWGELSAAELRTAPGAAAGRGKSGLALVPYMVRDILAKEGVMGCFRGLGATLVTVPAFWGVYFPLYDDLKRYWSSQYPEVGTAWIHMGSAVMAGVVSDIICNPMFVVRTRLQTEALHSMMNQQPTAATVPRRPKSMTQTAKALYKEGGILIFWRGMTANLLGLSHVAVQFPVYERLKQELRRHKRENSAGDLFLASAASKMTASLLTYPHEVIRSRMMDARSPGQRVSFVQTCRRIHAMEGFKGFYAGLPVTLLRVLPNTCITFMTYELLLQWAKKRIEQRRASPVAAAAAPTPVAQNKK